MVNQKAYDSLPADLQKILTIAMKTAAYDMYSQSTHENGVNLKALQTDYPNIKIRTFPKPVMKAIRAANDELLAEFAAKDPKTNKILESITRYQHQVRAWTKFADQAYLESFEDEK